MLVMWKNSPEQNQKKKKRRKGVRKKEKEKEEKKENFLKDFDESFKLDK